VCRASLQSDHMEQGTAERVQYAAENGYGQFSSLGATMENPAVRRPNAITNRRADPARMNPNRASEVSASPCLAMTCPPPHKKALQTAKMTAVAMMCLLYSIRVDLPVNRIVRKDIRRSFL